MADDGLNDEERQRIAEQKRRLAEVKDRIDNELRVSRPDRYEPGDDFLDDVANRIAGLVPVTMAQEMLARDLVGQREGQATRRVNRFLKGLAGVDGQYALPVDWHFYTDEPVAFEVNETDSDGNGTGTRRERVTLRAMTARDWRDFAESGRIAAQHRHDAEMAMYDAADWCAEQQGRRRFDVWADFILPAPKEDSA